MSQNFLHSIFFVQFCIFLISSKEENQRWIDTSHKYGCPLFDIRQFTKRNLGQKKVVGVAVLKKTLFNELDNYIFSLSWYSFYIFTFLGVVLECRLSAYLEAHQEYALCQAHDTIFGRPKVPLSTLSWPFLFQSKGHRGIDTSIFFLLGILWPIGDFFPIWSSCQILTTFGWVCDPVWTCPRL